MDRPKSDSPVNEKKWFRLLMALKRAFIEMKKPIAIALPVLILVWFSGRMLETMNGNSVFDSSSAYWLGIIVILLLIVLAVGNFIRCVEGIQNAGSKRRVAASWICFLLLLALVITSFGGFQVSTAGLLDAVAGHADSAQNAAFLLMKYHPLNPMLAVNLTAQKITNSTLDVAALAPYVWNWNVLLFLYVWSFSFGSVLALRQGMVLAKTFHLIVASCGLSLLLFLKSKSIIATEYMIMFQAAILLLLAWQALLVYASLRLEAAKSEKIIPPDTHTQVGEFQLTENKRLSYRGLPPSAVSITLTLLFILPIIADLCSQVKFITYSKQLIEKMPHESSAKQEVFVAVAPISIRSGPTLGDEILGALPKGTRIRVQGVKFDWINMGQNNWVPDKLLRPLVEEDHVARGNGTKTPS